MLFLSLSWNFCLPWVFFSAFTDNVQQDMCANSYTPTTPCDLEAKLKQLRQMMITRDNENKLHKRIANIQK